jgi:hypothetical protein
VVRQQRHRVGDLQARQIHHHRVPPAGQAHLAARVGHAHHADATGRAFAGGGLDDQELFALTGQRLRRTLGLLGCRFKEDGLVAVFLQPRLGLGDAEFGHVEADGLELGFAVGGDAPDGVDARAEGLSGPVRA